MDVSDIAGISEETMDLMKSSTTGVLFSTGVQGVDLSGLISLVPVNTKFRNMLPRVTPTQGAKSAQWRALLNVETSQANAAVAFDTAGGIVTVSEQDVYAPYAPLETVNRITQDSIDVARGYAEMLGIGTTYALNQLMISEDKNLIGAQSYALPTIGTPTVVVASTTGGTIASSTAVHVKVAARSGNNYYYGGSGAASSDGTVTTATTTSTNTVTASVTAVKGAVAYDWYVGSSNSNQTYYTTTTTNTVTITSLITAAQSLPSLPLLSTTAPTTPPTADTSYQTYWQNGLIASIVGDYGSSNLVTPGSGTSSGSYFKSLDGATLTASGQGIAELDALNLSLWNTIHLSPTAYMMNAQQAVDVTVKLLSSNRAFTMLDQNNNGRNDITGGGWVTAYINNAAGGVPIGIEVHPHLPPGTIIARTDRIPFPGANIDRVFEVRTLRDYYSFEYAANLVASTVGGGARHDIAVRSLETFINRAPVACGLISNIQTG